MNRIAVWLLALVACAGSARAPQAATWKAGTTFRDCADGCPLMVRIPGGAFVMGSTAAADAAEGATGDNVGRGLPLHKATVPAFAMGTTHVTRGQFAAFLRDTGYAMPDRCYVLRKGAPTNASFDKGEDEQRWGMVEEAGKGWRDPGFAQTDRDPVLCVSWNDANAYAAWLSRKTGHDYRLPSDTEWEYAARAGSRDIRPWGKDRRLACRFANASDLSLLEGLGVPPSPNNHFPCKDGYTYTAPAGSFRPNGFGLYDMLGNAWVYTADCWNEATNDISQVPTDGSPWISKDCPRRVERGGSWGFNVWNTTSGYRQHNFPTSHASSIGFRIARTR